jgi:uncharacterized repeat protein (TIGR02543 family)
MISLAIPAAAFGITPASAVSFNENDSPSDSVATYLSSNIPEYLTLFANLSPTFINPGYTFKDWNTAANGTGTPYSDGVLYQFTSNLVLYAQWIANPALYVVSYNDNGGTGVINPVTVTAGGSVQLPLTTALTNPGFTQTGWYTAATGGALVGTSGVTIIPPTSLLLYAQWVANVAVSITFSANAGLGSVPEVSAVVGSTISLPTVGTLLNPGYTFEGWSTSPSSQGSIYAGGATYVVTGALTLYALWTVTPNSSHQSILAGAIGPFNAHSSVLGTTLKNQVQRIARNMEFKGYAAASLFGYSLPNETKTGSTSLSAARALAVVTYLRAQLLSLHVKAVSMRSSGEGSVKGATNSLYRRVEVFLKL